MEVSEEKTKAVLTLLGIPDMEAFEAHVMTKWKEDGKPPTELECVLPDLALMGVKIKFARVKGRIGVIKTQYVPEEGDHEDHDLSEFEN